jgi:hypothetical protein
MYGLMEHGGDKTKHATQSHSSMANMNMGDQPVELPPLRAIYGMSTGYTPGASSMADEHGGAESYDHGGYGTAGSRGSKVGKKIGKMASHVVKKSGVAGDVAVRAMVQVTRLWFYFDEERSITVTKDEEGVLGLQPVRQVGTGCDQGWIVVRAALGSPCHRAGMPLDDVYLSHVNGECVSPRSCPSFEPRRPGAVTWNQVSAETRVMHPILNRSPTDAAR